LVAILGRRGRRPLPVVEELARVEHLVAILGRRGRRPLLISVRVAGSRRCCDPRPPRTAAAATWYRVGVSINGALRSSAAADGGRCRTTSM